MAQETGLGFDEFFESEKDQLLRVLTVVTGSAQEAEDIAQDAFTNILERWESVRWMQNPGGYLTRTAMNVFRSRSRRAACAVRRAIGIAPRRDPLEDVDDRDLAARALARLTPRQRAALLLTEVLGYSGEEAGDLLGVRASTVWALTHQARTALRGAEEDIDG
jgi:RNA polymerase sigma factor (sigma-70 family)